MSDRLAEIKSSLPRDRVEEIKRLFDDTLTTTDLSSHGLTYDDVRWLIAEVERLRSMFSAGVSVDAPHATSVDGDASHTSTAPAEPPQPTRPDPGITERKPRR